MPTLLHALLMVPLLVAAPVLFAQRPEPHVREGDRLFQQMAYARAAEHYRIAAELGAVNEHVSRRLGECAFKLGRMDEAERWFASVVKYLNHDARDVFHYAEALKSNGRYVEAEEWMDRYLAMRALAPANSNINAFARKFLSDTPRFTVRNVSVNSPFTDMGTCWLGTGRVLFGSTRNQTVTVQRRAAYNDEPFLDLFTADLTPDGDLVNAVPLLGEVNSHFHEGPATASSDGGRIWFTRNNYFRGRLQRSQKGIGRLGIFTAEATGDGYLSIRPFPHNNPEVSVGHPALSADGKRLFFASDMPGGQGGTDLYMCILEGTGWSEPMNLGPVINTRGNESFPFVAHDGNLYFASSGHPGLGGLDIFMAPRIGEGAFGPPINVGIPVNGPRDDFAFIVDANNKHGFFSSNRPGGRGGDDIYAFTMLAPPVQRYLVTGTVIDAEYDVVMPETEVLLQDLRGQVLATTLTDARGEYAFPVEKDRTYRIVAKAKGRFDGEQFLSTEHIDVEQLVTRDIRMVPDAGIWLRGVVRRGNGPGFLEGVTVSVVNLSSFFSESRVTGPGGTFSIRLQANEEFEVLLEKEGWFSISVPISTVGMRQGIIDLNDARDVTLDSLEAGVPHRLKHVRWPQGEVRLDNTARGELDHLAERLLVNPRVVIEVGVHEDARTDPETARKLTQQRADAIVAYLVGKGVPRDHVTGKGYGNSWPLNHCIAGVPCSEEEHAVNRRTEYKVTALQQR